MIELKPCPFCGSNCEISEIHYGNVPFSYGAGCTQCGCSLVPRYSKEEAAEVWNKRSNGWISCEDSLPKAETMVLVAIFGSDIVICEEGETVFDAIKRQMKNAKGRVTIGFIGEDGWYNTDGFPMICTPSYWMPLPTPPEVSENG